MITEPQNEHGDVTTKKIMILEEKLRSLAKAVTYPPINVFLQGLHTKIFFFGCYMNFCWFSFIFMED